MWQKNKGCHFKINQHSTNHQIAFFDLDGTLVKNGTGQWLDSTIPYKLRELNKKGFSLVILTNQHDIGRGKKNLTSFQSTVDSLFQDFEFPVSILVSVDKDRYRKPMTGMVELYLSETRTDPNGVDWTKSFMIGDSGGLKGDYSDSDRNLVINLQQIKGYNLSFKHANEWLGRPLKSQKKSTPYDNLDFEDLPIEKEYPDISDYLEKPTCVIMIGAPATGKSTYSKYLVDEFNFNRICQDQLKTKSKVIKAIQESVSKKQHLVIDRLNATREERQEFINLLSSDYQVLYFYMNIPKELSRHLVRLRIDLDDSEAQWIPDVVIHKFYKNLEIPTEDVWRLGLPPIEENSHFELLLYRARYSF